MRGRILEQLSISPVQTCWTFPPALDLSPGVDTTQKDERKRSNRRGMEEGRGVKGGGGQQLKWRKIQQRFSLFPPQIPPA
ncbi:hypothetical protein Y1Q_0024708 [Alligator mississippiensis]|uniref:Uncharacterized protein n=1 Tax=Alligator mississippiensis TaxID=8496 RepID=A0A151PGW6_ALLMI|nr:hypothetical protein Y1Q_0024708 [Alligator mississippiensis]